MPVMNHACFKFMVAYGYDPYNSLTQLNRIWNFSR